MRQVSRRVALGGVLVLALAACGTRVERANEATAPISRSDSVGGSPSVPSVTADVASPITGAPSVGETTNSATGSPNRGSGEARGAVSTGGQGAPSGARSTSPAGPSGSVAADGRSQRRSPVDARPAGAPADSPDIPAAGASSASGPAATITVGTLGTLSGPVGEVLRAAVDGVAVWVKSVNARGGVNGHPIRHVIADDGADPARHRSLVREMVERRGVQAFVYKVEAFAGLTGPDPYITEHKIPVVGTFLSYDWDYASPLYFPQASSGAEFNVASYFGPASELLLPKGLTKLGTMTCVESNVCQQANDVWARKAKAFGFDLVYQGRVSLGQPDFTAECLAAKNAGVQLMFFGFDDKSAGRVANSCARQAFRPQYIHTFQAASPAMLGNPNLDGMIVGTLTFPWVSADTPARQEFHADFARYLPKTEPLGTHATGWIAGKLFEEGQKALPSSFTPSELLTGLWQIRDNDLGGLTHPLSFFPDRGAQRHTCWSTVMVSDGKFRLAGDTRLKCRS
jgi:branched-chain amino acid transport system substrate-binding protein